MPKIQLELLAEREVRHLRIDSGLVVQLQCVCAYQIVDIVPEGLFIPRQGPKALFQIIIDRGHVQRTKGIGLVDLQYRGFVVIEDLLPILVGTPIGPERLFIHGIVLGHRLGVQTQLGRDGRFGISLAFVLLNCSVHSFGDHLPSCLVFGTIQEWLHTGYLFSLPDWDFYLPCPWEFYLPHPWDFCLPW